MSSRMLASIFDGGGAGGVVCGFGNEVCWATGGGGAGSDTEDTAVEHVVVCALLGRTLFDALGGTPPLAREAWKSAKSGHMPMGWLP